MGFMKLNSIIETVIYVDDLKKCEAFYNEVLGLETYAFQEGSHVFFKVGHSMLLFFNPDESVLNKELPSHFARGDQHFAFEVDVNDYISWKEKISKFVPIEHEHTWPNGKKSFYFRDTENNSVEIVMKSIWE